MCGRGSGPSEKQSYDFQKRGLYYPGLDPQLLVNLAVISQRFIKERKKEWDLEDQRLLPPQKKTHLCGCDLEIMHTHTAPPCLCGKHFLIFQNSSNDTSGRPWLLVAVFTLPLVLPGTLCKTLSNITNRILSGYLFTYLNSTQ